MMINKRLIGTVPESRKYVAGNVALQWLSLLANMAMMTAITAHLACLALGKSGRLGLTAAVAAGALVLRFACTVGASRMGYLSSKAVKRMSRVAHCIDNGPMEGFWGILKRERYYGRRFAGKQELVRMIEGYIRYYNTRRVQRHLGILTPMEKHELCIAA